MMTLQYNYTGYYAIQFNYIQNDIWYSQEYSNIVGSVMTGIDGLQGFNVVD